MSYRELITTAELMDHESFTSASLPIHGWWRAMQYSWDEETECYEPWDDPTILNRNTKEKADSDAREWAAEKDIAFVLKCRSGHDIELPNSCSLYWKDNEVGGRTYYSDEVGGGVVVWDTSSVNESTLLAALTQEKKLEHERLRNYAKGIVIPKT